MTRCFMCMVEMPDVKKDADGRPITKKTTVFCSYECANDYDVIVGKQYGPDDIKVRKQLLERYDYLLMHDVENSVNDLRTMLRDLEGS